MKIIFFCFRDVYVVNNKVLNAAYFFDISEFFYKTHISDSLTLLPCGYYEYKYKKRFTTIRSKNSDNAAAWLEASVTVQKGKLNCKTNVPCRQ